MLKFAGGIKCSVLMAHAFNDWNVVPEHSVRISNAVRGKVPLVQYFHQGGHGGDPPLELMNKWFSRFLYGISNGVESGPKSFIVREKAPGSTGSAPIVSYADYPHPGASAVNLYPTGKGSAIGGLELAQSLKQQVATFVDDVAFSAPALAALTESSNRLMFATPTLSAPVHVSGTPRVTIRMSASASAANLSVYLVQLPWTNGPIGTSNLITRGWADPQNAKGLKKGGDFHSRTPGTPLVPGKFVDLTFDLQPDDQIIPAGKKIGLMILSSDRDFTLWPRAGTKLNVDLNATQIILPIVGGKEQFGTAILK